MAVSGPARQHRGSSQSGQAVLEYAISAIVMATLAFGVVDFSRAIYEQEVITTLAGQGANLALRGTALKDSATAVINASGNLNLGTNGRVIVSAAFNNANTMQITDQWSQGGIT